MADLQELYDKAYDLLCDGNADEAIAAYKAILDIDPNHVEAVHDLAHAYADAEQMDDAIATARRLTELTPEDPMGFTLLSRFYQQKGMVPEAEAEAAKARMLDWKRQLLEKKAAKSSSS
ncbi:MAG: tetratricopeptide repeat protein [Candidatus Binatia bacterium]